MWREGVFYHGGESFFVTPSSHRECMLVLSVMGLVIQERCGQGNKRQREQGR